MGNKPFSFIILTLQTNKKYLQENNLAINHHKKLNNI